MTPPPRLRRERRYLVVPCPRCGGQHARNAANTSSRTRRPKLAGSSVWRWYTCPSCGLSFPTVEHALVTEQDFAQAERLLG